MKIKYLFLCFTLVFYWGCNQRTSKGQSHKEVSYEVSKEDMEVKEGEAIATFAGGCFWCIEKIYERIKGVDRVFSGYSGGSDDHPTYKKVSYGNSDQAEAIQVYYNPDEVSFKTLVNVFFRGAHNPTQLNRQGPDVGPQYRSIAFYRNEDERRIINETIEEVNNSKQYSSEIVTKVQDFTSFYPAEEYHQDYVDRHPNDVAYVNSVTKPKIKKFEKLFPSILKDK